MRCEKHSWINSNGIAGDLPAHVLRYSRAQVHCTVGQINTYPLGITVRIISGFKIVRLVTLSDVLELRLPPIGRV